LYGFCLAKKIYGFIRFADGSSIAHQWQRGFDKGCHFFNGFPDRVRQSIQWVGFRVDFGG
jgi:hypothetical protein